MDLDPERYEIGDSSESTFRIGAVGAQLVDGCHAGAS
jgi:hypothetical protein